MKSLYFTFIALLVGSNGWSAIQKDYSELLRSNSCIPTKQKSSGSSGALSELHCSTAINAKAISGPRSRNATKPSQTRTAVLKAENQAPAGIQ